MKNILITGFEPFGGEKINPSYEALKLLPETIATAKIHILCLPVVFGKNGALLEQSIDELDPDIIICVGQAGGRSGLTFEKLPSTAKMLPSLTMTAISRMTNPSSNRDQLPILRRFRFLK